MFSSCTPVAIHFGTLETRLLQLQGRPRSWSVRTARSYPAHGKTRHLAAAEQARAEGRTLRLRGRDATVAISGEAAAVSLVPLEPSQRPRLEQILQETAARSLQDEEGVEYRYLPFTATGADGLNGREEYLLLTTGCSELRRCREALRQMALRPVGLEMDAFPLARALNACRSDPAEPWGFLHIDLAHSLVGVVLEGELRFLKALQVDGQRLFQTLDRTVTRFASPDTLAGREPAAAREPARPAGAPEGAPRSAGPETAALPQIGAGPGASFDAQAVATLHQRAVGHAVEILHSLHTEAEALAQEIRACLRHFANRHRGARVAEIKMSGFGVALPEVERAIAAALGVPASLARPFTDLGIRAPDDVLAEEHQWCVALGLALRGYA